MSDFAESTLTAEVAPSALRSLSQFEVHSPPGFVCPIDRFQLLRSEASLVCQHCQTVFPIVDGVPILINDANSLFCVADYTKDTAYQGASGYGGSVDQTSGWRKAYRRFTRKLIQAEVPGSNVHAIEQIQTEDPDARVLVIGAGERRFSGNITYTDVAFAAGIACICDAHDLPFEDESFDAVIADSVLEHVLDPQRCVAEFVRVLRPNGYIMAVTPFLQPVHMGAHDFTRFTYMGHRRLFRQFDDIKSGLCGGPIYSAIHLFKSLPVLLSSNPRVQAPLRLLILLFAYVLRKADPFFCRHHTAYDASCATYFFGRKRASAIPDRDILKTYRGN